MAGSQPAAGRVIVIKDGHLLLIKRTNIAGKKYMVTPGGRVEAGETPEDAALREVEEETTVRVANPRLMYVEDPNDDMWGLQYVYLCDYVSGEPVLNPESEEYFCQQNGEGTYEPMWVPFAQLTDTEFSFKSPRLGIELEKAIREGFPSEPKRWTCERV